MKRRQFLARTTLASAALMLAASPTRAEGSKPEDFTPEAYHEAIESGEPFLLDFSAVW